MSWNVFKVLTANSEVLLVETICVKFKAVILDVDYSLLLVLVDQIGMIFVQELAATYQDYCLNTARTILL